MRGFFRKWGAVALALVLSLSVFAGMDGSSVQAAEDHAEDWMADIDGETMLSSISIPGTHDSATQYVCAISFNVRTPASHSSWSMATAILTCVWS